MPRRPLWSQIISWYRAKALGSRPLILAVIRTKTCGCCGPSTDPDPAPAQKFEPKREIKAFEKYPLKALKVLLYGTYRVVIPQLRYSQSSGLMILTCGAGQMHENRALMESTGIRGHRQQISLCTACWDAERHSEATEGHEKSTYINGAHIKTANQATWQVIFRTAVRAAREKTTKNDARLMIIIV